jgi:DNA-binding transcriptional LysR family regulator
VLVVLRPTAPRDPFTTELPGSVADELGLLRERPVLLPAAGTAARQAANAAFADAGFSPLPRFETSEPGAARELVAAGLAVGIVPASWANGHGTLTAEPLPRAEPVRPVLIHRPDLPRPAAALADALRALLG